MSAVPFDTLKFVEDLTAAGVPEAQAKAIARAFKDVQAAADFATKADLRELEHRIISKMYQAMLIQTFALAALIGALKIFG